MATHLFRKTSLERNASPEQLDQFISITTPRAWILLCGIASIIIGIIIWGFAGSISQTVTAKGIVFPQKGAMNIVAEVDGQVSDVRVRVGDYVLEGETLAVAPQQNLLMNLKKMKSEPAASKKDIDSMIMEYENKSIIKTPVAGQVMEILSKGDFISPGEILAKIIQQDQSLNNREVIAYVDAAISKKLRLGMEVQVSPDFAPREEYGYMQGYVTKISNYPVNQTDLVKTLGNEKFANGLLPDGNAVEVRITLNIDPDALNMVKWSNKKGGKLPVEAGTTCKIQIIVNRQKPINLIIPENF